MFELGGVEAVQRWIIHVDMDAFYAAVEQRDCPEWKGKPVIVGGLSSRGVVATASYEARRFGVHSAMSMAEARRRCPEGIFVTPNHGHYAQVSKEIHGIFAQYSPLIEPLSLDEAFLDVTGMEYLYPHPREIALALQAQIYRELKLTASVGVAPNKFLAKLASDLKKPQGLVVVEPGTEQAFLEKLPIGAMWGVGDATALVMKRLGIQTIGQLARTDVALLLKHCGQVGLRMHSLASGQDVRPVEPERAPKSIGNEETFDQDLLAEEAVYTQLLALSQKVGWRLRQSGFVGRTITVKIRFASFHTITRSHTLAEPTAFDEELYQTACAICKKVSFTEGVRLLGITVANLQQAGEQISLFAGEQDKKKAVYEALDRLRDRFGEGAVTKGRLLEPSGTSPSKG